MTSPNLLITHEVSYKNILHLVFSLTSSLRVFSGWLGRLQKYKIKVGVTTALSAIESKCAVERQIRAKPSICCLQKREILRTAISYTLDVVNGFVYFGLPLSINKIGDEQVAHTSSAFIWTLLVSDKAVLEVFEKKLLFEIFGPVCFGYNGWGPAALARSYRWNCRKCFREACL